MCLSSVNSDVEISTLLLLRVKNLFVCLHKSVLSLRFAMRGKIKYLLSEWFDYHYIHLTQ